MGSVQDVPPAAAAAVGSSPREPKPQVSTPPPCSQTGRTLAYLYFIRFSLLLWLSMLLFPLMDGFTGVATATRGIVTLANGAQCFWAAFIVVLAGWVALLSARIICAYGGERFGVPAPERFRVGTNMSLRVFVGAQVPGLVLLGYSYYRTVARSDGDLNPWVAAAAFLAGAAAALVAWYALAILYYWIYPSIPELIARGQICFTEAELQAMDAGGELDPKAFAAPVGPWKWLNWLTYRTEQPAITRAFDGICSLLARRLGAGFCRFSQSSRAADALLHSGQALALLVMGFLALLYFVLFYFTAPVPMPLARAVVAAGVAAFLVAWLVLALPHWRAMLRRNRKSAFVSLLIASVVLLPTWALCVIGLVGWQTWNRFPVLSLVYILIIFACWGLGGLAFLLDRARVPVMLTIVLLLMAEHWIVGLPGIRQSPFGQGEHVVATQPIPAIQLPQPQSILDSFATTRPALPGRRAPLIVVTATGGGIHAAAWTSGVLTMLEQSFNSNQDLQSWNRDHSSNPVSFHNSILLMSSVSGGSFGVDSWMHEYGAPDGFQPVDPATSRVVAVPQCSSLEAIAWGLVYPDIFHLILPFRWFQSWDRGWALQAAVDRNRANTRNICGIAGRAVGSTGLTLQSLAQRLSANPPQVPAVSLNSTMVETGDRFLLANYGIPFYGSADKFSELLPAASFLDVYAQPGPSAPFDLPPPATGMQDLPLTAAARLSASFPYVSPMPRVAPAVSPLAYHFGDGGYYDNDGTSTAIEFLCYAYMGKRALASATTIPAAAGCAPGPAPSSAPDDIVLVEIRDSANPYADRQPDSEYIQNHGNDNTTHDNQARIWGPMNQLNGPFAAFYNAGHASVTRRNRRELCTLEAALAGHLRLRHFVFDFVTARTVPAPLSWHLTVADIADLKKRLGQEEQLGDTVAATFAGLLHGQQPSLPNGELPCSVITDTALAGYGTTGAQVALAEKAER